MTTISRQFTLVLTSADGQVSSRFECEAGTPEAALAQFAGLSPRTWLYGLTADEWLHLASEGEDSEVQPCCGNLGELRDLLRSLATFQSPDDTGWQLSIGRHITEVTDGDGEGHGLHDREQFPLLHRVLDGIRTQQADPDPFGLARNEGPSWK